MIDVANRVLTNIKTSIVDVCKTVSSNNTNIPSTFPVALVDQIDSPDRAMDLENSENAVNSVIEIQTYSNKSLSEAKIIMSFCCDAMRLMGYVRLYGPRKVTNANDTNIFRMVARFNRIVSSVNDIQRFN